ncbi:Alpha/Beta hydrolase fold [Naviculisporaceae sp. PSN 640]
MQLPLQPYQYLIVLSIDILLAHVAIETMRETLYHIAIVFASYSLAVSATQNATTTVLSPPTSSLPIVDLGYELHQALSYNSTSQVYKFQNIRYAQAPVGELRFRAPVPPKTNRTMIETGAETRTCPQGVPRWQAAVSGVMGKFYDPAVPFNLTIWEDAVRNAPQPNADFNAASSEDCLFLDVHVPRTVLKCAGKASSKGRKKGKGAPVLVWIHGGGYVLGSKSGTPAPSFNPHGLMWHAGLGSSTSASPSPENNIIFVAINYRLGAPGFLSSTDSNFSREGGTPNAGILDQRLALEWIQKHIHLFGGDKDRVTVMGESAGGGSILIHMAAYGGKTGPAPFKNAIPQSPAFMPTFAQPETAYRQFLSLLNVTSLSEARRLPSSAIIAANEAQIALYAPKNNYIFGPVIDGSNGYIPAPVSSLLREGKFDTNVAVLAGHNSFEGGIFFDPEVTSDEHFRPWLERSIPGLRNKEVDHLVDVLYPAVYDSPETRGYVDVQPRQMALWGEAVIDCNFVMIGNALASVNKVQRGEGKSWAYQFAVKPGFHIQDTKYVFNDPTSPAYYTGVQDQMQEMLVGFVKTGVPRLPSPKSNIGKQKGKLGEEVTPWKYSGKMKEETWGNIVRISEIGLRMAKSEVNMTRCDWWSSFQDRRKLVS